MTLIWPFSVPLCLALAANKPEIMNMYENLITHMSPLSNTIDSLLICPTDRNKIECENNSTLPRSIIMIEIQNAWPDFWSKTSISGLKFLSRIQSILEITCFQPSVLAPIRCNSSQHFTATDGEKNSAGDPRPDKKLLKCVFTGGGLF